MEFLANNVIDNINKRNLEHFHEFLCGRTNVFTNYIYATKDYNNHKSRHSF